MMHIATGTNSRLGQHSLHSVRQIPQGQRADQPFQHYRVEMPVRNQNKRRKMTSMKAAGSEAGGFEVDKEKVESCHNNDQSNETRSAVSPSRGNVSSGNESPDLGQRSQTEAAKERRRERNKVLARKTRVKKKVELESLRTEVFAMSLQNQRLKEIIKMKLPRPVQEDIFREGLELPENVITTVQMMLAKHEREKKTPCLKSQKSFCISDPTAPGNPLIYASPGFIQLTGYRSSEILGRNCKFLQGEETDPAQVKILVDGMTRGVDVSACLLNYRKNGTKFYNFVQISPLLNFEGKIALLVGVQQEIGRSLDQRQSHIIPSESGDEYGYDDGLSTCSVDGT